MEDFVGALVCDHKNDRIPEEYNFFGKLVGVWDLDWNDHLHEAKKRRVKGEWIFSWVLEGMAIPVSYTHLEIGLKLLQVFQYVPA